MKERIFNIYSKAKAKEYLAVLDEFDKQNIKYILLNVLVADDNPGDLDIFILNKTAKNESLVLNKLGYVYYFKYDTHQYLWNKYIKGVGFVQIHIYESISYNGKQFLQNNRINTLSQLDENFNFYIFLIESLYKLKLRDDQYIAYRQIVNEVVFKEYLKGLTGEELAHYMIDVFEGKVKLNKNAWARFFVDDNRLNNFFSGCRKLSRRIYRLFHNHDVEVLFLGVDGSGKSTVIKGVSAISAKGGMFPQIKYMGLRGSLFSPNHDGDDSVNINNNNCYHRPMLKLNAFRLAKLFLYWCEYNLKYLFVIRLCKQGSDTLFLIDRCYLDLLYYYPYKLVEKMFLKYSFLPKKIVFLTGNKEILYNRKREMSESKFNSLYSFYEDISEIIEHKYKNTFFVVDTSNNDIQKTNLNICDFIML